jgi:hypothetical protein
MLVSVQLKAAAALPLAQKLKFINLICYSVAS